MRICHITNPVRVPETSDLFIAQPITFASMLAAKERSPVEVTLLTAQYPEDRAMVPAGFVATPDLERSIRDIHGRPELRKLPPIADIIQRALDAGDHDVIIYTNVDIGLYPHFYRSVVELLQAGHDAFTITRRTLDDRFTSPDELEEIWREEGEAHPGFDCFVFRRDVAERLQLGDVCLGSPPIDSVILCEGLALAGRWAEFMDRIDTFHIGDDRSWRARPDKALNLLAGIPMMEASLARAPEPRRAEIERWIASMKRWLAKTRRAPWRNTLSDWWRKLRGRR